MKYSFHDFAAGEFLRKFLHRLVAAQRHGPTVASIENVPRRPPHPVGTKVSGDSGDSGDTSPEPAPMLAIGVPGPLGKVSPPGFSGDT